MGPLLEEAAAIDDEDHVGGQDGGEAVRDRDRGAAGEQRFERRLDQPFTGGVEGGGGFVEDEHAGRLEDHPGDGQALLLTARHPVPALADQRVVAVIERDDAIVDERRSRCSLELLLGCVGLRIHEVATHRGVEEIGLLRDHADRTGQ